MIRALNRDVFRRITKYAELDGLTIQVRHGDTPQSLKKKISDSPPDVLITTPETLVILLTQQKMLTALSELERVIIDEVHELLSSERGSQLSISLERLQLNSNQKIIRTGLSATVGNIEDAGHFLVGTEKPCKIIQDKSMRKYDVEVKFVKGSISEVADSTIQYIEKSGINSPILLFTNTRGESEFLASVLREKTLMNIELHHGSLSKQVREETESILRSGSSGIVVCTSSLELGLDIGSVELVIHYGSPRQVSKLMQRIGRSKHFRNSSARGLIITNSPDDEFETKAILDRIKNSSIEEQKIHNKSLDVLAHHLVGLSLQMGELSVDFTYKIIGQAYPFRNITLAEFCSVLEILDSIYDSVGKKIIGSLDQRFVGDHGEAGNIFVLRGMQWRILNIDEKALQVNVEPMSGAPKNVPYWEGENIPIDYDTAQKVGLFRNKVKHGSLTMFNKIIPELDFNIIPDEKTIVIESVRTDRNVVIHACFGTKINSTLATILSSLLESTLGYVVQSRSDAYRIVLESNARISKKILVEALTEEFILRDIVTAILDLVKKRLFKTKHRLICARCGKWQLAIITEEVKKNLSCKYCKSRQITTTFYSDHDLVKIIQKKHTGKKLSAEENQRFKRAWKVASLVETFGKNAIIVLSGYGVGADTGARILRNMIDQELMYKQIYEAERQYVMTRGFWDD